LKRVVQTAAAQDVQLELDSSLVNHLADVGYDPESGARLLKRKVRSRPHAEAGLAGRP